MYNSCNTLEKPSIPLKSDVANNMTCFFVVIYRHGIYSTKLKVLFSGDPTMFLLQILIYYICNILHLHHNVLIHVCKHQGKISWLLSVRFWAGLCPKLGLNPPFTARNCPKLPQTAPNCLKLPTDYESAKMILG